MTLNKIDLHMHSTASDGDFSPKELIDMAIKRKISAIALTEHNTIKGNEEALKYSEGKNIKFIPGIEITVTPPKGCRELHIVGLFIDSKDSELLKLPKKLKKNAEKVVKKIIKKLNDLGYEITFEDLFKETGGKHFGRPFIAKILMRRYPEEFKERGDVFDKLLGKQGKAFVMPIGASLKDAIEMIHNAGRIAIIAHPWYLGDNKDKIIQEFINLGGEGIERNYIPKESIPKNTGKILDELIKKYNLVVSGGTDFHKLETEGKQIGDTGLSKEEFEKLKECARKL